MTGDPAHLAGIHDAPSDGERPGDRLGGQAVIAGDHHHPDAGGLSAGDRLGGPGRGGSISASSPRKVIPLSAWSRDSWAGKVLLATPST